MSQSFSLSVPADARYRVLGPELAAKYVEMLGGSSADAGGLATAIAESMQKVAGADAASDLELEFHAVPAGIEVRLRSAGGSTVVTHRWPVARR
jgi:hypothetical protein